MRRARVLAAAAYLLCAAQAAADWALGDADDPQSSQPVTSLSQDAIATIGDEYGTRQVRPRLEFRCSQGSASLRLRIDWQRFISSFDTEVSFAADAEEPLSVRLAVDRSNEVTSTRDAGDAASLAAYLAGRSELAVTVTPYAGVPVTIRYDLAGLDAGLEQLRDACGG